MAVWSQTKPNTHFMLNNAASIVAITQFKTASGWLNGVLPALHWVNPQPSTSTSKFNYCNSTGIAISIHNMLHHRHMSAVNISYALRPIICGS